MRLFNEMYRSLKTEIRERYINPIEIKTTYRVVIPAARAGTAIHAYFNSRDMHFSWYHLPETQEILSVDFSSAMLTEVCLISTQPLPASGTSVIAKIQN